jgi:phosphoenolpyruvate carboxykinase (ATP)
VYAEMLGERLRTYGTRVYLVNTGWTGGAYGTGARINLAYTRRMVTAALSGELATARYVHDERFGVDVPQEVEGVPSELLNPRETWADRDAYDAQAEKLARMFQENAAKKYPNMPDAIRAAGPRA